MPLKTDQFDYPQVSAFETRLIQESVQLKPVDLDTVQINVGKLCNQSCTHCHVEAGPNRKEIMSRDMAQMIVEFVKASGASTVDLTGGAPELNPSFRFLIREFNALGCRILLRSNLSVLYEPQQSDLPALLAENHVQIIASLPCYTEENVDQQRGPGVYRKSIEVMRKLNKIGYGKPGSELVLNLVYNPLGAFLPSAQDGLEKDYKKELDARFGLTFDHLLTITNMPIGRFGRKLSQENQNEEYLDLLSKSFNPATLQKLMCLHQVSISWDGYFFDCDFNQMLAMPIGMPQPLRLGELSAEAIIAQLMEREIQTGIHCFGCTAGSGSSCAGALTD
jgi:radical SAM/Cys-rich protein